MEHPERIIMLDQIVRQQERIAELEAERDQALSDNDNLRQRIIELEDELRVVRGE